MCGICKKGVTLKRSILSVLFLMFILTASSTGFAQLEKANLDKVHSKVGFTAATMLFDVDGEFKKFDVMLDGDHGNLSDAKIRVEIDAKSVFTSNRKRDEHLRSGDFFNVSKHPKLTFVSNKIRTVGDKVIVDGTLEILGKKKNISIPFEVTKTENGEGKKMVAYKGSTTIDRTEFGVGANSVAAKISLKDDVELDLLIVAMR